MRDSETSQLEPPLGRIRMGKGPPSALSPMRTIRLSFLLGGATLRGAGEVIGQQRQAGLPDRLAQPPPVPVSIGGEFQEKLPVVAAVSQVIDRSGNDVTVSPWHSPQGRLFRMIQ